MPLLLLVISASDERLMLMNLICTDTKQMKPVADDDDLDDHDATL